MSTGSVPCRDATPHEFTCPDIISTVLGSSERLFTRNFFPFGAFSFIHRARVNFLHYAHMQHKYVSMIRLIVHLDECLSVFQGFACDRGAHESCMSRLGGKQAVPK